MVLIIAAAVRGFMGRGVIASHVASGGSVRLSYSRFERMNTTIRLDVTVEAQPTGAGDRTVWFARDYLRRFEVSSVTPEPESVSSAAGSVVYFFASAPGEPLRATFWLRAAEGTFGMLHGRLGAGGSAVDFWQFVWP
jgi:hypothetical protein